MKHLAWIIFIALAVIYLISALSGCAQVPVAPAAQVIPAPVAQASKAKVSLPYMRSEWTDVMLAEIKDQLPNLDKAAGDMQRFCPKYKSLSEDQRVIAWAHLATAMIKFESGVSGEYFKTCSSMTESNGVDSIGLFQLSYGDSFCPKYKSQGNLCDVAVNIKCGVKIMGSFAAKDSLVASGGYTQYGAPPAKGLARYWSVIRVPDSKRKHQLAEIKALAAAAPGCSHE